MAHKQKRDIRSLMDRRPMTAQQLTAGPGQPDTCALCGRDLRDRGPQIDDAHGLIMDLKECDNPDCPYRGFTKSYNVRPLPAGEREARQLAFDEMIEAHHV